MGGSKRALAGAHIGQAVTLKRVERNNRYAQVYHTQTVICSCILLIT